MGGIVGSILVLAYIVAFFVFWAIFKVRVGRTFNAQCRIIKSIVSSAALLFFLILVFVIIFEVGSFFDLFPNLDIKLIGTEVIENVE